MINIIFVCVLAGAAMLRPFFDEKCSTLMRDSMYNIIDMRDIQHITLVRYLHKNHAQQKQRRLRSY